MESGLNKKFSYNFVYFNTLIYVIITSILFVHYNTFQYFQTENQSAHIHAILVNNVLGCKSMFLFETCSVIDLNISRITN